MTVRPPLTSTEKTVLKELVETLAKTESQFCSGGTLRLPCDRKLRLFYTAAAEARFGILDLLSATSADVQQLINACAPSPHGRGNETVFDESYRLARELHQENFALTADILNESGVLSNIAALISPRKQKVGLVANIYKLNGYTTGGFFKAHRDTPKSDRHIGTLVVALPIPFEGGALRVSHEGKQVLFDWGQQHSPSTVEVGLPWAFLFSDVEHEVLPVTSGTRITLAYDIFASSNPSPSAPLVLDGTTLPFYSDLQAALKKPDFLPRGGKLGIALSHAYPFNMDGASDAFASHLKGADAALHRALSALGINMTLRAVYAPDDGFHEYEWKWEYDPDRDYPADQFFDEFDLPHDEYGPIGRCVGTIYPQVLYTSDSFEYYEGHDEWHDGETKLLMTQLGARVEPEIIWARKPSIDAFAQSGYYVRYGNEATLGALYAAAAIVLDIPAVGQSARLFV